MKKQKGTSMKKVNNRKSAAKRKRKLFEQYNEELYLTFAKFCNAINEFATDDSHVAALIMRVAENYADIPESDGTCTDADFKVVTDMLGKIQIDCNMFTMFLNKMLVIKSIDAKGFQLQMTKLGMEAGAELERQKNEKR